jgi:hypothetical protein
MMARMAAPFFLGRASLKEQEKWLKARAVYFQFFACSPNLPRLVTQKTLNNY